MARLRKTALTHHFRPITEVKGCEYIFNFIVTAVDIGTVTECGICGWPWKWFALVKDRTSFVTTNWYIPVKDTLDRSAVVFCSCEIIQTFYVAFCVVWAVHKFDFRLLIDGSKNCAVQWQKLIFWQSLYVFSLTAVTTDSLHCVHSFPIALHNKWLHVGADFSLCVFSYGSSHSVSGSGCPRPRVQGKGIHIFEAC